MSVIAANLLVATIALAVGPLPAALVAVAVVIAAVVAWVATPRDRAVGGARTKTVYPDSHPFSDDRPINSPEEDVLGRGSFARAIATAIQNWKQRDSLVIALYGRWGSGKTSIKNLVTGYLKPEGETPRTTIVEFNPWQWSAQDQIAAAFFDEIGAALGTPGPDWDRRRVQKWLEYAAYLRVGAVAGQSARLITAAFVVAATVSGIGAVLADNWARPTLGIIGVVLLGVGVLLAWSRDLAEAVAGALSARMESRAKSLEEMKGELAGLLDELDQPIVVVIDDIDRLSQAETSLVFQLVKANADFPNLVYLMMFERSLVERMLSDATDESGREYLEKIVQVGFDVPQPATRLLEGALFASLDTLLELPSVAVRWSRHRWARLFVDGLRPYFANLRHVRRFASSLAFQVSLLRHNGTLEVNPIDLIGLETLRVFEPDVYRMLPGERGPLTSTPSGAAFGESRPNEAFLKGLIDAARPGFRDAVMAIMKELFPPAAWAFGGSPVSGFEDEWLRDLRVCHPLIFDRYFLLAIPSDDISQAEIDELLRIAGDRSALRSALASVRDRGLLDAVLVRLEAYKQELDLTNAVPFVTALFDIGDSMSDTSDDFLGISPAMHAVRVIYWYLRKETDSRKRAGILRESITQTTGLFLPIKTIATETRGKAESTEELNETDLVALEQLLVEKIRAAARSGALQRHPQMLYIAYRWKEWSDPAEVRTWVSTIIKTPAGVMDFLHACIQTVRSIGLGEYVVDERVKVDIRAIEGLIPVEVVDDAVEQLSWDALTSEERSLLEAFRAAREGQTNEEP